MEEFLESDGPNSRGCKAKGSWRDTGVRVAAYDLSCRGTAKHATARGNARPSTNDFSLSLISSPISAIDAVNWLCRQANMWIVSAKEIGQQILK
jgi:hypothetical protein